MDLSGQGIDRLVSDRRDLAFAVLAATSERGKERFLARLQGEIAHIKADFPNAYYVGLADGAKCNWTILEQHTDTQVIDFLACNGIFGKGSWHHVPGGKADASKG
ncbi:MAG: hypothetical protein GY807_22805 [Gammaproteobacteria bacterium]|nr:hypothetical protein [Gammaproteobacteria bacterium]